MILRRHPLDLLRRERQPDRQHRVHFRQRRNGAVEVAFSIAEPAARAVEGGERDEEGVRKAFGRVGAGFAHAEAALDQNVAGPPQAPAQVGMADLRQRDLLPAPQQRLHEGCWIDLAADRPIAPDGGRIPEFRQGQRALGDGARRLAAPAPVQGVAALEHLLPKRIFGFGRGR